MNANLIDWEAQLWWWNGATYDAKAIWYTELYDENEEGLGYAGWGDFDMWMPIVKTFAPGESFWIQVNDSAAVADATFTMAGQVESVSQADQYYAIPVIPGVQQQLTNPFPTGNLSLQNIKMSDKLIDGQAQLWWWNGATYDAKAIWYTELYDENEEGLGYAGWGDFDMWMPIEKTFSNGEAFWVQVNDSAKAEDATVSFPNPFYKAPAAE